MKRWAIAIVTVAGIVILSVFYWNRQKEELIPLPGPSELESITVGLDDQWENMAMPPLPDYSVPRKYFSLILSTLTPAVRDRTSVSPETFAEVCPTIGHLALKTKNGKRIFIEIYFMGQNPNCFSVDGIRCFRGGDYMPGIRAETDMGVAEGILLAQIIREIHRTDIKGEKSEGMKDYLRLFKKATGRDPPLEVKDRQG